MALNDIYSKASLTQIPSGYKNGKLYSILPSDGNGDFTYTRATSATKVNKDGLVESVEENMPRLNYPLNGGASQDCPSLLLERTKTNLLVRSEDFSNTWITSDSFVETNIDVSPNGTITADKLTVTAVSGGIYQDNISVSANTKYTFSFYVKRGTVASNATALAIRDQSAGVFIDLDVLYTAEVDKWTRIEHTFTTPVGCTSVRVYPQRLGGTGVGTLFLWGAQLEQDNATSYIPTTSSTVTRADDICYKINGGDLINQTEGTLYLEFVPLVESGLHVVFQIRTSGTPNSQVDIRLQNKKIVALGNDGGSPQFAIISPTQYSVGTTYKCAIRYKQNDSKFYINGVSVGGDTSCSFTSGGVKDQISFNQNLSLLIPSVEIKDARIFNEVLSDSELQTLTS